MIPSGMPQASVTLPPSSGEVLEADIGDVRLTQRAALLLDCLADHAGESFPTVLDDSELEGAYRLFGNRTCSSEPRASGRACSRMTTPHQACISAALRSG
jgi:Transposase DNA-binding